MRSTDNNRFKTFELDHYQSIDEVGTLLPVEIDLLMYQYHAYFACLTTSDHISITNDHIFGTNYQRSSIIDHQYSLLSLLYLVAKLQPNPLRPPHLTANLKTLFRFL